MFFFEILVRRAVCVIYKLRFQMACTTARTVETRQQPCRRECMLLGKRANNGMSISFSHIRNHKLQQVNLQWKRVYWPEGNCMVRLRLSTKAIKTLKTKVRSLRCGFFRMLCF